MEVVIKVSDERYETIKKCFETGRALSATDMAIILGTQLPKGHGRLIDADAVTESFQTFYSSFTAHYDGDFKGFKVTCIAPTVVEADKEGEEECLIS